MGKWHALPGRWDSDPRPAFAVTGSAVLVANFGEFRFVSSQDSVGSGVKLFNGVWVRPTNRSAKLGIEPGDLVEARDLSFRGIFAGEYKGFFLVSIAGIDGAVALDVTSPPFVRRLQRVIGPVGPRLATCLVSGGCAVCEMGGGH